MTAPPCPVCSRAVRIVFLEAPSLCILPSQFSSTIKHLKIYQWIAFIIPLLNYDHPAASSSVDLLIYPSSTPYKLWCPVTALRFIRERGAERHRIIGHMRTSVTVLSSYGSGNVSDLQPFLRWCQRIPSNSECKIFTTSIPLQSTIYITLLILQTRQFHFLHHCSFFKQNNSIFFTSFNICSLGLPIRAFLTSLVYH